MYYLHVPSFFISSLLIIRLPCQSEFMYLFMSYKLLLRPLIEYNPVCVPWHLCLHRVFWRQMRFARESKISNTYHYLIVDFLFNEDTKKYSNSFFLRRGHIRFHWNNRYSEKPFDEEE